MASRDRPDVRRVGPTPGSLVGRPIVRASPLPGSGSAVAGLIVGSMASARKGFCPPSRPPTYPHERPFTDRLFGTGVGRSAGPASSIARGLGVTGARDRLRRRGSSSPPLSAPLFGRRTRSERSARRSRRALTWSCTARIHAAFRSEPWRFGDVRSLGGHLPETRGRRAPTGSGTSPRTLDRGGRGGDRRQDRCAPRPTRAGNCNEAGACPARLPPAKMSDEP